MRAVSPLQGTLRALAGHAHRTSTGARCDRRSDGASDTTSFTYSAAGATGESHLTSAINPLVREPSDRGKGAGCRRIDFES